MEETDIFSHVYEALLAYLPAKVPELRYTAQDFGQLEVSMRPAVSFPGTLIDFENAQYSDVSAKVQLGDGIILFRLFTNPYSDDSNLTPETSRTLALSYYALEAKLFKAVQGWGDDYFGNVTRISAVTEKREDTLRVRQIRFAFAWKDDSAFDQQYASTLPDPVITVAI